VNIVVDSHGDSVLNWPVLTLNLAAVMLGETLMRDEDAYQTLVRLLSDHKVWHLRKLL